LAHVPALDGLRGVAVVGVLAFHLGHLRGGFLGVDLFFVLSGFLITSLLLAEHDAEGRVGLGAFWARRARRLLPALLLLLIAIAVYAATDPPEVALGALRGDALATLGYVANWHATVADHGYWDLFTAPSLLAHTWSLAIEEQLYVLWPLVVVVALRFGRRALLGTTVVLGVASAVAMVIVHGAGDDTSRVYFGTDTRAAAVLVGAALAIWGAKRLPYAPIVGVVAAIGLGIAWCTVGGTTGGLYEGGFALCSVAGALVLAGSMQPGPLATVFSLRPLRHLGAISYGVYLWHWPVFVVLDARTDLDGWTLLAAKLALTFAISEASYHLLELPIRRGSLRGWRIRIAGPAAAGVALVAVVAGTAAPAPASVTADAPTPPAPAVVEPPAAPGTSRLLVVGDSGALYLGEGMERVAPADVQVRNAGTIGCGLLTAGERLRLDGGGYIDDPDWCDGYLDRWRAELDAFDPDTVLLEIAWPGLGDRMIDGAWRHPCDEHFDAHYTGLVRAAISTLGSTGARVVVADSPYLTLPVVQQDHAQRVDCLNAIYHREAEAAGASILGLRDYLCDDARHCTIETDGVTLRTDGIHFRDEGADIAARWALAEIEQQQDTEDGEGGG
jgi:peptidoglycan/LPS O-acetylase OafA/YrhL